MRKGSIAVPAVLWLAENVWGAEVVDFLRRNVTTLRALLIKYAVLQTTEVAEVRPLWNYLPQNFH